MKQNQKWVRQTGIVLLFLIFGGLAEGACSRADAAAGVVPPNIIQLCRLPRGNLIALTEDKNGLFFSSDNGIKWRQALNLPDAYLYSAAADVRGNLFLATASGVYQSTDGGASWRQAGTRHVAFLSFSPTESVYIAKIWGKGLFIGALRQNILDESAMTHIDTLPPEPAQCAVFTGPAEIFAGYFGKGAYRSVDGGRLWREANTGLSNRDIITLGVGPRGRLFAGTYGGGLFAWFPQRGAWTRVDTGLTQGILQCLAFGPDGAMVAGSRGEGVVASQNDGEIWQRLEGLPENANIHALALSADGSVFAGVYGWGLGVSRNGGREWRRRAFAYVHHVTELATGPQGRWYVAVKGVGWLVSDNRGKSWSEVSFPFPVEPEISLVTQDHRLFAGSRASGVFVSTDGGRTWKQAIQGLPVAEGVNALRGDGKGNVFAVLAEGTGLFRWDGVSGWQRILADDLDGDTYSAWDLMFLPGGEALVWGYNDILMSKGGLSTWHRMRFGQAFREIRVDADLGVWTQRALTPFVLRADGTEWEKQTGMPADGYVRFARIDGDRFIGVRGDGGADMLRQSGNRLEILARWLKDKTVLGVTVDTAGTILAGTQQGVWVSADIGQTWREMDLTVD